MNRSGVVDLDLLISNGFNSNYQSRGTVYILENAKAQRVKVGVTGNDVEGRLRDANDKWLGVKVSCQICETRLINKRGLTPQHVRSGRDCPGGGALPIEKDVTLAEAYLEKMKSSHNELSGSEKGSVTKKINNLERRIELFRNYDQPVGIWQISTIFDTGCPGEVESLSHEILSACLDKQAPFGEVFCCSVSAATEAVEAALCRLGLLQSASKETRDDRTSEKYGQCAAFGHNLTARGACPECTRRLSR